ncbi:hypothetical protein PMIN04_006082 [Paraphaeosphaeria minitans]
MQHSLHSEISTQKTNDSLPSWARPRRRCRPRVGRIIRAAQSRRVQLPIHLKDQLQDQLHLRGALQTSRVKASARNRRGMRILGYKEKLCKVVSAKEEICPSLADDIQ